mmetsp:Transcript_1059/g.2925  ORF Transcript_1059/g.2925 Transcript_1059/m.2925 type:complete len:93 (-) Transcript_1059:7-285(-)
MFGGTFDLPFFITRDEDPGMVTDASRPVMRTLPPNEETALPVVHAKANGREETASKRIDLIMVVVVGVTRVVYRRLVVVVNDPPADCPSPLT